ncbi:MAG TPA: hypothetical protein EYQ50_03655 [Verrucomicrobiales bacterium]|nr:hypothetical protein [Verrucomicrobiales bacterium]HIL70628.1 hypothetical protein [Verrucomicrobiota bacterium]
MMRKLNLFLLLSFLGWSGCSEDSAPSENTPTVHHSLTARDGYEVTYKPNPNPIPLNDHFALEITVTSADKSELPANLIIEVDADMPTHKHGINTVPTIRSIGKGQFLAEGLLFHMAGDWEIYIDVIRGPVRERATFPMTLK